MWATLAIAITALVVVLTTSIILYFEQEKIRSDVNKKLNSVVDQINDSQFYEYNFDKQQEENIKNIDKNVNTLYKSLLDAQKNIKFLGLTAASKDEMGKAFRTGSVNTSTVNFGNKFTLNTGTDDWLKLQDKSGRDYYGGLAAGKIFTQSGASLNGTTNITGTMNVQGAANFMGGKSSLNPKSMGSAFPFIDGKNYIRGDTEVLGHVTNSGSITSDRVRVGHSSGQDDSRLSVVAAAGKNGASFGGPGGLFSHLPYNDNNTYIRPGREGSSVYVGDVGASVVSIGKGDTNVNVRGPLTIYDKSGQKKLTMQSDGSIQINGTLRVCDTNGSRCKTI